MQPARRNTLLSARLLRPAAIALAFLTRLPVSPRTSTDEDLGRAVGFFPLAGGLLGLALAGAGLLLRGRWPPVLVAFALVALLAWATAGLHLDGWADLCDGLGGSRGDRTRMLEIMRDSRIGALGATALFLLLGAKVAALAELLPRGDPRLWVAFPVVARWAVVPLVVYFPYARPRGTGKPFSGGAGPAEILVASALALGAVAWAGGAALLPAAAAAGASLGLGLLVQRRLGGLTGDAYGAAIELAEVVFLACAARRG